MGTGGSLHRIVVAVAGCAMLLGVAGCAADTVLAPSPMASPVASDAPIEATPVAEGVQDGPVQIEVNGDPGVGATFTRVRIAAGATTGEHCHHGYLIAVVEAGELTHYAPTHPDGVATYVEGDLIVEGPDYVHEGRNERGDDVVLWVAYLIPEGEPLAETDLANCDQG
ncbi:hypothetical protein [Agromyces rhizosphaerae]|nr:hypothetical protein [Agromyces rhizosphaerae]